VNHDVFSILIRAKSFNATLSDGQRNEKQFRISL